MIFRGSHHHEIHRLEGLFLSYGEGYLALLSLCHRRVDTRIVIGSHAHQSVAIAIAAQCLKHHGQLLARLWHSQANGVKSIVLWNASRIGLHPSVLQLLHLGIKGASVWASLLLGILEVEVHEMAIAVEHLVVECLLRHLVLSLIGYHWVFALLALTI